MATDDRTAAGLIFIGVVALLIRCLMRPERDAPVDIHTESGYEPTEEEIRELAYGIWETRDKYQLRGTPESDWFGAKGCLERNGPLSAEDL